MRGPIPGSKTPPGDARLEPQHPFRALYRQAGRRWLIFLVAMAALVWLGFFAGMVRNPGGVKQPWAVMASRAMAAVGGILVVRLLLFSYEERVPVLYVRPGAGPKGAITTWIGRLRGRKDSTVPLSDVVAFMAARRYVPRGGLALVLEAGTIEEAEVLADSAGNISVTILLPATVFEDEQGAVNTGWSPGKKRLPDSVDIGAALVSGRIPAGPASTGDDHLKAALLRFAEGAKLRLGKTPVCAYAGDETVADPGSVAEAGGYACFLGGEGYNRFGDAPHLIRLLDISPVLRHGRQTGLNLRVYIAMFKGAYVWWPVAALLRAFGASPGWA